MSLFEVGLTRDLLTASGQPSFGIGPLDVPEKAGDVLQWEYIRESVTEITPDVASRYDAIYVNAPNVTAASVARSDCRLALIARHGVGYDSVDISAMTRAGVLVTNTPIAVRRPVATMAITSRRTGIDQGAPAKSHRGCRARRVRAGTHCGRQSA